MHGHAALAQRIDEDVMFLACTFDPKHVIEQQRLAIAWGETAKAEIRPMHDDLSQPTRFGMDPEFGHDLSFR